MYRDLSLLLKADMYSSYGYVTTKCIALLIRSEKHSNVTSYMTFFCLSVYFGLFFKLHCLFIIFGVF